MPKMGERGWLRAMENTIDTHDFDGPQRVVIDGYTQERVVHNQRIEDLGVRRGYVLFEGEHYVVEYVAIDDRWVQSFRTSFRGRKVPLSVTPYLI